MERPTTVFLPEELIKKIKQYGAGELLSMKEIITIALTEYFQKREMKSK